MTVPRLQHIKGKYLDVKKPVRNTQVILINNIIFMEVIIICYCGLVSETSIYNPIDPQERNKNRRE